MILFTWIGIQTTAEIVDGKWSHGLPEVAETLETIAPAAKSDAEKIAAERLGGVVVSPPTGEPADGSS